MRADIRLKDFNADSVLTMNVEGNGQKGTLASYTSKRSIRDIDG